MTVIQTRKPGAGSQLRVQLLLHTTREKDVRQVISGVPSVLVEKCRKLRDVGGASPGVREAP